MKFKKQLTVFVVMFSMLINTMSSTLVFAGTINYSKSLEKIKQLGIFDSSIQDGNSVFTKGQMMRAIAIADGLSDIADSSRGETIFPDVDADSELSGYVNAIMTQGFFYGTDDGYLHRDRGVTYEELCVMLVRLLGYSKIDLTGSYPNNYIKKAADLKLTTDIRFKREDIVPVWAAAVMFDRALDTDVKRISTIVPAQTLAGAVNLFDDYIILKTSKTSEDLSENEVYTDKGMLYLQNENMGLEPGETYRLSVDSDNIINKIYGKTNDTLTLIVKSYKDNVVSYEENGTLEQITMPANITYYSNEGKVDYSKLSSIIKTDSKIVFEYNENNSGYSYAVIVDPKYSTPVIASNFDPGSYKIGDIVLDYSIPITRNGQIISKSDIEDLDVVYNVTDIDGNNRFIQVFNDRVEGNITNFIANGSSSTGIQMDNVSYKFSKDMDLNSISSLKAGDLVSAIEGYNGNIISIKSTDHKLGKLVQGIIVGNSKTSDKPGDNQVLVNQGGDSAVTYSCLKDIGEFTVGAKYSFYVDGSTITKINKKMNSVQNYAVSGVSGSIITYTDENNAAKNMTLPEVSDYYYQGNKVDYNTAIKAVQSYSSIVIGKNNDGSGDLYAVIADPCFGKPEVYRPSNTDLVYKLNNSKYDFIRKNGMYMQNPANIAVYDVVYFVSDLWNKNTYVYVYDKTASGSVTALTPNSANPSSIQINNREYVLSKYFDKSKLNNYSNGSYSDPVNKIDINQLVILILGIDGKVVDVY